MTLRPGQRLVIDASVAVKWVVSEVDSRRAEILLDHGLVAPDLIYAECANVLWKKVRRREMTPQEAGTAQEGVSPSQCRSPSNWIVPPLSVPQVTAEMVIAHDQGLSAGCTTHTNMMWRSAALEAWSARLSEIVSLTAAKSAP